MTTSVIHVDYYGFHGFTKGLDLTSPAACVKFSDDAKSWIDELTKMCEKFHHMSKPETFNVLAGFLYGEADEWYQTNFTDYEKFRLKNLKNFTAKFKGRYCQVTPTPSKSEDQSIQILVDRIEKLESLAEIVQKQKMITSQQEQSIQSLQAKVQGLSSLEEKVAKLE